MKVCYWSAMEHQMFTLFPEMRTFGVLSTGDLLEEVLAGRCAAALVTEIGLADKQALGNGCTLTAVGKPVISYLTGFYAADWILNQMTVSTVRKIADGTWTSLWNTNFPVSTCPALAGDDTSEVTQLHAEHLLGNCLLLLGVTVVAVVLHFYRGYFVLHRCDVMGLDIISELDESRQQPVSDVSCVTEI